MVRYKIEGEFSRHPDFSVCINLRMEGGRPVSGEPVISSNLPSNPSVGAFTFMMEGSFSFLRLPAYEQWIPEGRGMAVRDRLILDAVFSEIEPHYRNAEISFRPTRISSLGIEWIAVGIGAYTFVKDYSDMRSGIIMLANDLSKIGKKLLPSLSDEWNMQDRLKILRREEPWLGLVDYHQQDGEPPIYTM